MTRPPKELAQQLEELKELVQRNWLATFSLLSQMLIN